MSRTPRTAVFSLALAGALWGLTVPLSKLGLHWLSPGWLAVVRFTGAVPPLAWAGRRGLRAALTPGILAVGAVGFGAVILLQNAGIARTSVSHAAVIVGVVPILVALIAGSLERTPTGGRRWAGYGIALVGIACIAGRGGGGSSATGDGLVAASAVLSALCIAVQPRLLAGREATAVTAVQFMAGGLVALPAALLGGESPARAMAGVASPAALAALAGLVVAGTLLPFTLFALGQARVPARVAGAFTNLEPLVGAVIGWVAFGDAAGPVQILGGAAVLAGILLSACSDRATVGAAQTGAGAGRLRAALQTRT